MHKSLRVTTDFNYNSRLKPIKSGDDIPARWRDTPIEQLINAHNFGVPIESAETPQLMVATCIEFRFQPMVPKFFAYELRQPGGRLIGSEFTVAYALCKGVRHMALIGHNDCGMTKVAENSKAMEDALVAQGWSAERAQDFVTANGPRFAIRDEVDALQREYLRVKRLFKNLEIAPLFTALANSNLYIPTWYNQDEDKEKDVSDQDVLMLGF